MTFLEMVRATRLLCGMQGIGPSSVSSQAGIEEVLISFVKDAWIDIQNHRDNWNFMEATSTFSTSAGKASYTLNDIFFTPTPIFKHYKDGSFIITDTSGTKKYLRELDWEIMKRSTLNATSTAVPSSYSTNPSNKCIKLSAIPDGVYTVEYQYYKSPEILSTDAQVPTLPVSYHKLIVYRAVEKMAIYLNNPETFSHYSREANKMQGELMRSEISPMASTTRSFVYGGGRRFV